MKPDWKLFGVIIVTVLSYVAVLVVGMKIGASNCIQQIGPSIDKGSPICSFSVTDGGYYVDDSGLIVVQFGDGTCALFK